MNTNTYALALWLNRVELHLSVFMYSSHVVHCLHIPPHHYLEHLGLLILYKETKLKFICEYNFKMPIQSIKM